MIHSPFTFKLFPYTTLFRSKAGPTEMHVRVQGSVGTTVTYDHTYTVSNAAPAFINFDYLGEIGRAFVCTPVTGDVIMTLTVTIQQPGAGCTFVISPRDRAQG